MRNAGGCGEAIRENGPKGRRRGRQGETQTKKQSGKENGGWKTRESDQGFTQYEKTKQTMTGNKAGIQSEQEDEETG